MIDLTRFYRWCDDYGGGLVVAASKEETKKKLAKYLGEERDVDKIIIWEWANDDYFDEENPYVFDIYS